MAEIDAELVERVVQWCAEAGRRTDAKEVVIALEPLGWDELLAARALLADPPPARPLGPHALADLARGAPADVAAEREREGRYRPEQRPRAAEEELPAAASGEASAAPARRRTAGPRRARSREIVIHRARDRAPAADVPPAALPSLEALRAPEGRATLERLVREHGARRAAVLASLGAGWRTADGAPPSDADLAALLDQHGLARAFERRERDELLHALRAAGGVRADAATRLGLDVAGLEAALERLGAAAMGESIRGLRREELRGRATLTERVRLLVEQEDRLRDLGVLEEFERDLRQRLPEHLRALRAGAEPVVLAFARSLSLPPGAAETLAQRFALELGRFEGPRGAPRAAGGDRPRDRAGRGDRRSGTSAPRGGSPAGRDERGRSRPGGTQRRAGTSGDRRDEGGARGAFRPRAGVSASSSAPRRPRPGGAPGARGERSVPRPGGPARTSGPPRPGSARPASARPGSARTASARSGPARPPSGSAPARSGTSSPPRGAPRPGSAPRGPRPGGAPPHRRSPPRRPPR